MPDELQDPATETAEQKYARLYQSQGQGTQTATPQAQPDYSPLFQELRQELASLREQVAKAPQATPAVQAEPAVQDDEWLKTLGKGDVRGARKILAKQIREEMQGEFTQLLNNANAQTQAQIETASYRDQVKARNADLLEFEPYLEAPLQRRLSEAQAAGKIKNTLDYVREYKAALDAEVAQIRNISLKFRASGKDEATTRRQAVIDSSTLSPQQVQSLSQTQDDQQPQAETTEDYFKRREEQGRRMRGLS